MRKRVAFVLVLTGGVRLINHQWRFGCEDAHIVDKEVVTIIVRRHIEYAHAEVIIVLILLYREEDLVPLIRLRNISCQVGGDIFPNVAIHRALHGEEEVRAGLIPALTSGVCHISGEVHLLALAQMGFEGKCGNLTGG